MAPLRPSSAVRPHAEPPVRPAAPPDVVARLAGICRALPEVREEAAWVGTRWRVRRETFAHVLMVDAGWPPAYAAACGSVGPLCVLTFRSPLRALDIHAFGWKPFFRPPWFADIVGMRVDEDTDWDEVGGLLRVSYRHLAPASLAAQVAPAA